MNAFRLVVLLALLGPASVAAAAPDPLVLAEAGRTRYRIVVAQDAGSGEQTAAENLAKYLGQMTGAAFAVTGDDEPASAYEIVLGDTNRKSRDEIPADLRTDAWEGFVLLREGARATSPGPRSSECTTFSTWSWASAS